MLDNVCYLKADTCPGGQVEPWRMASRSLLFRTCHSPAPHRACSWGRGRHRGPKCSSKGSPVSARSCLPGKESISSFITCLCSNQTSHYNRTKENTHKNPFSFTNDKIARKDFGRFGFSQCIWQYVLCCFFQKIIASVDSR